MVKILSKKPLCFVVSMKEISKDNPTLNLSVDYIAKKGERIMSKKTICSDCSDEIPLTKRTHFVRKYICDKCYKKRGNELWLI